MSIPRGPERLPTSQWATLGIARPAKAAVLPEGHCSSAESGITGVLDGCSRAYNRALWGAGTQDYHVCMGALPTGVERQLQAPITILLSPAEPSTAI